MSTKQSLMVQPWEPLKWKPVYEQIVALHMAGYKNVEIAALVDMHPVQIGNILRSNMAKSVIDNLTTKIRRNTASGVTARLEALRETAVRRVEECLTNDELAEKNPHAMANMGINFLKGIGSLSDGSNTVKHQLALAPEFASSLAAALAESNTVKQLHTGEAEDADYEVIETRSDPEASKSS